jgi:hypothetical protein
MIEAEEMQDRLQDAVMLLRIARIIIFGKSCKCRTRSLGERGDAPGGLGAVERFADIVECHDGSAIGTDLKRPFASDAMAEKLARAAEGRIAERLQREAVFHFVARKMVPVINLIRCGLISRFWRRQVKASKSQVLHMEVLRSLN